MIAEFYRSFLPKSFCGTSFCQERRKLPATPYYCSNEDNLHLFLPYQSNLGSGLVSVGSDQGLDLYANGTFDSLYQIDYDPRVLHLTRTLLVAGSKFRRLQGHIKPTDIFQLFQRKNMKEVFHLVQDELNCAQSIQAFLYMFGGIDTQFSIGDYGRFMEQRSNIRNGEGDRYTWYSSPDLLTRILDSFEDNKIRFQSVDLTDAEEMIKFGDLVRNDNSDISTVYLSNAEGYVKGIRGIKGVGNILNSLHTLPIVEDGIILRTVDRVDQSHHIPFAERNPTIRGQLREIYDPVWHYNIESISHHLRKCAKEQNYDQFGWQKHVRRTSSTLKGVSILV